MKPTVCLSALAAGCWLLGSCGGGGSPSGTVPPRPGARPFGNAVIREMTISEYNPLLVIGSTSIVVDGAPVDHGTEVFGEVALITGQFFSVSQEGGTNGEIDATMVEVTHPLDGVIDAIDLAHSRLTVLGFAVFPAGDVLDQTFTASTLASLTVGERVTVGGYISLTGEIAATRLVPSARSGDALITGYVAAVDAVHGQLTIGPVAIDYSTASLENMPGGAPAVGERVRVYGSRTGTASLVRATSVTGLADKMTGVTGTSTELRGVITRIDSKTIEVDGHALAVGAIRAGSCKSAPVLNTITNVSGTLSADGSVAATDLCSDPLPGFGDYGLAVTGRVDAIDPLYGSLSILGFAVQVSPLTPAVENDTKATLAVSDIHVGDAVQVFGAAGAVDNSVSPIYLVRSPSTQQSTVYAGNDLIRFADPFVYVAGRAIGTDSNTQFSYIGPSGNGTTAIPMTRELFFSNPRHSPYWDPICTPYLRFLVNQNEDGSLIAVSVRWEPDYHC